MPFGPILNSSPGPQSYGCGMWPRHNTHGTNYTSDGKMAEKESERRCDCDI